MQVEERVVVKMFGKTFTFPFVRKDITDRGTDYIVDNANYIDEMVKSLPIKGEQPERDSFWKMDRYEIVINGETYRYGISWETRKAEVFGKISKDNETWFVYYPPENFIKNDEDNRYRGDE